MTFSNASILWIVRRSNFVRPIDEELMALSWVLNENLREALGGLAKLCSVTKSRRIRPPRTSTSDFKNWRFPAGASPRPATGLP